MDMSPATEIKLSPEELQQRQEIFRYTDQEHPLMKVMFNFRINKKQSPAAEFDQD